MNVTIKKLPNSTVELIIEIPADQFARYFDRTLSEIGQNLEVKGFRKGNVPSEIVEKNTDQGKILDRAASLAIKEIYPKAILENNIQAISRPRIEILKIAKDNPLQFKAIVSVLPDITLPDYKKIAAGIKPKKVEITDQDIEKLKQEKQRIEKQKVREEILQKIALDAKMEIPAILIESEQKQMLEEMKQAAPNLLQISFQDYLKKINKTEQQLLESFRQEAQKRVKNFLILKEIGKKENIAASEQEIRQEMDKYLKNQPNKQGLDMERLKLYTKENLILQKTLERLETPSLNDQ